MTLVELEHITIAPEKNGRGIHDCSLCIDAGQILSIGTDSANDAHLLIKGLATLSYPTAGIYRFQGEVLDFSDYRNLLSTKKNLGYLSSSSTLISNRTLRDNLCMGRVYFDNDLSLSLDDRAMDLCRDFGIDTLLDRRPVDLGPADNKRAMTVREIIKTPRMMLVELPETYSGYRYKHTLIRSLQRDIEAGMAMVYLSYDDDFINAFPGKRLEITGGTVTVVPASPALNG
jgi:ABC-type lipoprotein export system ATPase subunit